MEWICGGGIMRIEAAVIRGDGVGPEMMEPAVEVLQTVCSQFGHTLNLSYVPACSESIERCYHPLPQKSLEVCQSLPAVLFGNSGLSKYRNLPLEKRPEAALLGLRKGMGVTTNLRPVTYYPALSAFSPLKETVLKRGLDFVFVRDIVGGVFCSDKVRRSGINGQEAFEYEYYNEKIVMDTAQIAFSLAQNRKRKVTNLDKSNVLESSRLWRNMVERIAADYPEIQVKHDYIDHAAMQILATPETFDVIVTSNLFGDIISDEGTQMTGTPYMYASAEINRDGRGIYTPNQLHHPDESVIGKQVVNPIGMIMAAALMLRFTFKLEEEANVIERVVQKVIKEGFATRDIWTEGKRLVSTREMGQQIKAHI